MADLPRFEFTILKVKCTLNFFSLSCLSVVCWSVNPILPHSKWWSHCRHNVLLFQYLLKDEWAHFIPNGLCIHCRLNCSCIFWFTCHWCSAETVPGKCMLWNHVGKPAMPDIPSICCLSKLFLLSTTRCVRTRLPLNVFGNDDYTAFHR